MTGSLDLNTSTLDRIRHDLVGLKMPRALEALDQIVRRLEQSEIGRRGPPEHRRVVHAGAFGR